MINVIDSRPQPSFLREDERRPGEPAAVSDLGTQPLGNAGNLTISCASHRIPLFCRPYGWLPIMSKSENPSPPGEKAPAQPYAVLQNRNFVLYTLGRLAAVLGQQMLSMAVGWELYERTHSPLCLGLVGLTQIIPMFLFTLPAGHWADNLNRKHIILWMTALAAIASLGLTWVSVRQSDPVWTYAWLFLAASARAFIWPASQAFLTQIVPRAAFARAVAWNSGTFQLSSVTGPVAGGAIIAYTGHAWAVFALNAGLALTCLILQSMIRYRREESKREPMTLTSLAAGFRFVFATRIIIGIITLDLFAVLLGGATALLPIYAKDILHTDASGLGLLQAALPLGSLAIALVVAHRPPMNKAGRALLFAVAGFGLATIGFGFSKVFWFSWAMLFCCGATDSVSVVVRQTLVQLLTPDEKRGRVSAVNSLFIGTSNELGGFESGLVAEWFGPVFSAVSGGFGTLIVVGLIAWFWPEIRRYGRLE
jgi:MFS family permease